MSKVIKKYATKCLKNEKYNLKIKNKNMKYAFISKLKLQTSTLPHRKRIYFFNSGSFP